jgi:hypothetical protein
LSVSVCRDTAFSPQKGHIDRAQALTVRLLWMLWIAVEKAQKASPPHHNRRESSASLQLKLGFPQRTGS